MRTPNANGSALITALFIMTLIAITATAIIQSLRIDIARTTRFIRTDQLYLAAQGVHFWAMTQLQNPTEKNQQKATFSYPGNLSRLYPGIQLSGEIHDLQAFFNINNLTNPAYIAPFTQLIQHIDPELNDNLINMIVQATQNWISPQTGVNQDKWNSYYASMRPPYQTPHQLMRSVSEFQFIAGVTQKLYHALHTQLTALPEPTPININTASASLLKATLPQLADSQIDDLLSSRSKNPILTQEAFNQLSQQLALPAGITSFRSTYFLSVAHATQGKQTLTLFTILKRTLSANKTWKISIVRESINDM
ncbi:MAG: type II secretion system minor pseudopilin GspK [Gammaproteobacteria bacterium]|nr:type II secretion system minor pseudopilin GspK [Gammaproteobacteria bacterium]